MLDNRSRWDGTSPAPPPASVFCCECAHVCNATRSCILCSEYVCACSSCRVKISSHCRVIFHWKQGVNLWHIQHDIFPQGCRSHLCCDRCVCLCVSLICFAAPLGGAAWALSSVPLSHCSLFQRYIYMLAAACVAPRCCFHLRRLLSSVTPLLACPQPIGVCLALWGDLHRWNSPLVRGSAFGSLGVCVFA